MNMQYINGCWNVGTLEKKVPKKVLFSLMARPLTPPPLNGPAIKRRTFFCGFPKKIFKNYMICVKRKAGVNFRKFRIAFNIISFRREETHKKVFFYWLDH